jgi:hypothetical protein
LRVFVCLPKLEKAHKADARQTPRHVRKGFAVKTL